MIVRKEIVIDAVFLEAADGYPHPIYQALEYVPGRRGKPCTFFLYSKGPGVHGVDPYGGPPTDESSRVVSADEARAWVRARIAVGDIRESVGREALEYLDEIPQPSASASASR